MKPASGIILIDTDCLKYLEDRTERRLVSSSAAVADFEVWPSGINVLEAGQNKSPAIRHRALQVVAALAEGRGLLPLPEQLLYRSGRAIVDGEPGFFTGTSGLEEVLDDPGNVQEGVRAAFQQFMDELESGFDKLHDQARPLLQRFLRERSLLNVWSTVTEFLDHQWMRLAQLDTLIDGLWARLGLPGSAPRDKLLASPVWRLFFELEGVAIFERSMVNEQPRRVHHADLLQVLCSAGASKRVIVTNDQGLRRAASAVLVGRYPLSRVMSWAEFRGCHL